MSCKIYNLCKEFLHIEETPEANICACCAKSTDCIRKSVSMLVILKNKETECLFYDKVKKIQLRIKTQSYILHDKKKIREYWEKVPLVSRQSYSTKLPPSTVIKGEQIDPSNGLSLEETIMKKAFVIFSPCFSE